MASIIIIITIVSSETSLGHLNRIFANMIYGSYSTLIYFYSWHTQEIQFLIAWNMNKFSYKLSKLSQNFTGKIYICIEIWVFFKEKGMHVFLTSSSWSIMCSDWLNIKKESFEVLVSQWLFWTVIYTVLKHIVPFDPISRRLTTEIISDWLKYFKIFSWETTLPCKL